MKISLTQTDLKLPLNVIGIDMGQSLTKIAFVENNDLMMTTIQTQSNFKNIKDFLDSKKLDFHKFNFTGGKAFNLYKSFSEEIEVNLYIEFEANVRGLEFLYKANKNKKLPPSLIITIGTGTSMILKNQEFEHVGGSAIGGGLFMALIRLLFNITDYDDAISLAKKGNRYNVDLKVSDIYAPKDQRVDLIFREFTAASLGKIVENYDLKVIEKEDVIASIINMIGENLGTIACLMAEKNEVDILVFCGGFLINNRILKKILSLICKVHEKKSIFLKNSEYIGAIGALLK